MTPSTIPHNALEWEEMEQPATTPSPQKPDKPTRTMADITPLEPPIDSFSESIESSIMDTKDTNAGEMLPSLQIQTPPETPELPHVSVMAANCGNDPPMFPDTHVRDTTRSMSPLIRPYDLQTTIRLDERKESNERSKGSSFGQHRRTESTTYPSILGIRNAQEALDYHRSCVNEMQKWRREIALPPPEKSRKASRRDVTSTQQVSRLNQSGGIGKPQRSISPRPAPKPVATPTTPLPPRRASAPKKTKTARAKASSEGPSETSQGQKKHTRAAPTKNISNQGWREIEDFTPPIDSLDGKSHNVKWTGAARNITAEVDYEFLHPTEAAWATTLRLEPAQYLATKRRIFKERVRYLNEGRTFTKTAAQQVAKLDVNKLSRLHEAFDAVGWFDECWFRQ